MYSVLLFIEKLFSGTQSSKGISFLDAEHEHECSGNGNGNGLISTAPTRVYCTL